MTWFQFTLMTAREDLFEISLLFLKNYIFISYYFILVC